MLRKALAIGGALFAFTSYPQFILWTIEGGRKVPISPYTLLKVDVQDRMHHMPAAQALAVAESVGMGLAFAFTSDDPFWFADIDHAYEDGVWSDLAREVCNRFPTAAVEISQSGTGLHLFGKYSGAEPAHSCKNIRRGLELYTSKRFVALTGSGARGDAGSDCSIPLSTYILDYFQYVEGNGIEWSDTHAEGALPLEDDDELIKVAMSAGSIASKFDTTVATFKDLWEGDLSAKYSDRSSADRALAQHLAFYTGNNCERMLTLMQRSGLVRDKWTKHRSYLKLTIQSAVNSNSKYYCRTVAAPIVTPAELQGVSMRDMGSHRILGPTQQEEYFAGCVYVTSLHRVFTPEGLLLKPDQFKSKYSGYDYMLTADGKKMTGNAWEAFVESKCIAFPKANSLTFDPTRPTGDIQGSRVNTYVPIITPRKQGDVTPFLTHLKKILPAGNDSEILLSYMAAVVQYKGHKFEWAPLIQGAEGNGKTLFTRCLAQALGSDHCHFPKASDIDNKFNAWLLGKILIGVEDIYVPESRREIMEALKPMITGGDGIEIQYKGADQITANICANFILNSNHKDALIKTANDRRFCVFYSAQQSAEDIKRDGMGGSYFPDLYTWLREGGYAMVTEFLYTYRIPEHLNPATLCKRAPSNSSSIEVVSLGAGNIEQAIAEEIRSCGMGFSNGWVSSLAMANFLKDLHCRYISVAKYTEILSAMGYVPHPGLPNGHAVNRITVDNGRKPRLFVHVDNPSIKLTKVADIEASYIVAQTLEG